jgi:hypothetical protein
MALNSKNVVFFVEFDDEAGIGSLLGELGLADNPAPPAGITTEDYGGGGGGGGGLGNLGGGGFGVVSPLGIRQSVPAEIGDQI